MSNQKNKLRSSKSVITWIYAGTIMFLLLLGCCLYLAYMMISYRQAYDTDVKFNTEILMDFFNYFSSSEKKASISLSIILECLKYQITKLWWVYGSAVLIVFIMATSNTRDEFRGMEHGSASWADKYAEKEFKDKTGIPLGKDTYVTIENKDHKSYSPHNVNEFVQSTTKVNNKQLNADITLTAQDISEEITNTSYINQALIYMDKGRFAKANIILNKVLKKVYDNKNQNVENYIEECIRSLFYRDLIGMYLI